MDQNHRNQNAEESEDKNSLLNRKQTSMGTLIIWNISKALETNPRIELKSAMKEVQERLESNCCDLNKMISKYPEERHLACAFLAWQEIGHKDVDSLCRFIEDKQTECNTLPKKSKDKVDCCSIKTTNTRKPDFINNKVSNYSGGACNANFDTCSLIGPVIKLPVDTKIVMRLENTPNIRQSKKQRGRDKDIQSKIDAACCMDSSCVERLAELDAATTELRMRADRLARREAERVELLERAEAAWKDLELGYQRRLVLAKEKEDDISKQVQKMIEERNDYKNICTTLATNLKEKGEAAEKDRARLTQVEKDVYDRACVRLRISEEATRGDATVAEHQCKAAQLDRDLQFKEDQARRKLMNMESEVESARVLTHEAERALRSELAALRDQIAQVSNKLLQEEAENNQTKDELEELRQEKLGMVEDLEGCKIMCDSRMQAKIDELKRKREELLQLKGKVMECQCKLPIDVTVEAKRTPSLVALCKCSPEDKILDSCSCTSLRSRLLSNLLADLFGGLQAELGGSGSTMPCQLLKCLEDKHNWDRASVVKTNLQNFFSQLLIGELDIAIATSIENYHAKWVGASCADVARIPDPGEDGNEGWQERALEHKAQKLANKLAEQLFQERAEQLVQRAKDIVRSGPPPCECKTQSAVYSCFVKPPTVSASSSGGGTASAYWRKTFQDVTQLRAQMEDLKKETIRKEDLKLIEQNIAKLVQRSSVIEKEPVATIGKEINNAEKTNKHDIKNFQIINAGSLSKNYVNHNKVTNNKKRYPDINYKKGNKNIFSNIEKTGKKYKRNGEAYAVNMCLYESQKDPSKLIEKHKKKSIEEDEHKTSWKEKPSDDIAQISAVRKTKPIINDIESTAISLEKRKTSTEPSCKSNCACFHKMPSNTSIDQLLEILEKWKSEFNKQNNINDTNSKLSKEANNDLNTDIAIQQSSLMRKSKKSEINSNISYGNKSTRSGINNLNNEVDESFFRATDIEGPTLPPNTESEYMGAINLDKSNVNLCKCAKDDINNYKNKYEDKFENKSKFPLKCIKSEACSCKKSLDLRNKQTHKALSANENHIQVLQSNSGNEPQNIKIAQTLNGQNNLNNLNNESNKDYIVTDENHIVKNNDLFKCDCESYNIKFLGVTLANTNSQNNFHEEYILKDNELSYKNKKQCFERTFQNNNRNKDQINELRKQSQSSICNVNFDEFKDVVGDDTFNKPQGDFYNNKDEAIDSQSFNGNNIIDKPEICICCDTDNLEESQNLEDNTFHLLEEHLKGRLEEFRQFSCKSSCISSTEQEKMFTAIFQRVKDVISNSTNKFTCKCPGDKQIQGSWNRAYMLLQEYLKTKIKRVQCFCVLTENENTILPNVLEEVCNLIENDFKRLKDLCKCQNTVNKDKRKSSDGQNDEPERDINLDFDKYNNELSKLSNKMNDREQYQNGNINKISKLNSSNVLTQSMSSQVPNNLGMKTKSCDAMEKGVKNIQTTESHVLHANKYCNSSETSCHHSLIKNKSNPYSQITTNEILVNHCADSVTTNENFTGQTDIKNDSKPLPYQVFNNTKNSYRDEALEGIGSDIIRSISSNYQTITTPYVGYTIDCSCNKNLGLCICTKSLCTSNNEHIKKIFKKCTTDSLLTIDTSYIMDSVSNKNNTKHVTYEENNDCMNNIPLAIKERTINTCEMKLSAHNEDEMLLKDSFNKNLNMSYHTVNTSNDIIKENDTNDSCQHELFDLGYVKQNSEKGCNDDDDNLENTNRSESYLTSSSAKILNPVNTHNLNCDCDMVPICHVKMLIENIEQKLINSNCTCDSLCTKVCPVHSNRNI